jgi:DNA invertase Pin-like site-specific DNA recombinase
MTQQSPDIDDPVAGLPPFLSQTKTARFLGISKTTVWRLIKSGKLQVNDLGKVTKASIRRLAQPREVAP